MTRLLTIDLAALDTITGGKTTCDTLRLNDSHLTDREHAQAIVSCGFDPNPAHPPSSMSMKLAKEHPIR